MKTMSYPPIPYQRYPWQKWFDRGRFILVKGVDYGIRLDTMLQQIRNMAGPKRFNVSLSIHVTNDSTIFVTVIPRRRKRRKRAST